MLSLFASINWWRAFYSPGYSTLVWQFLAVTYLLRTVVFVKIVKNISYMV